MASYFDAQPHIKSAAEREEVPDERAFGRPSLLSPQVTSILDDLENHSSTSSDIDDGEESEVGTQSAAESDERNPRRDTTGEEPLHRARTSTSSPKPQRTHHTSSPKPEGKLKQPHFARFHSLRSMLFQSNIERNMQSQREGECQPSDPTGKWKDEHDHRRGFTRSKSPDLSTGAPPKDGLAHRVGNKLRRLTSKDAPTMTEIREDGQESTASSDDEGVQASFEISKKHDETMVSDDESIHHSDVEDLMRWISRRDPPSDGESRRRQKARPKVEDSTIGAMESDHESLGHSDVDDLVHWVGRKTGSQDPSQSLPPNYGEASTESDSQGGGRRERERSRSNDSDDEDVDESARWVSPREAADAGPVKKQKNVLDARYDIDSDQSELARWMTKEDNASGESDVDVSVLATAGHSGSERGRGKPRGSLSHKDVDELVRWVGQTSDDHDATAEPAKQPSDPTGEHSTPTSAQDTKTLRPPLRETLTHDDVDDLVRWVSRRHDSGQDNAEKQEKDADDHLLALKQEDEDKKAELGITHDKGSLAPEDVDELVRWVSRK